MTAAAEDVVARVHRCTKETQIEVRLSLTGQKQPAKIEISTGVPFLDHMLHALAKHARWALYLKCRGDLEVDDHHSVEDVAICLGRALRAAAAIGRADGMTIELVSDISASEQVKVLERQHPVESDYHPAPVGYKRFGYAYAPLDEALARAVVDLSNRPYAIINLDLQRESVGTLSTEMVTHFLHTFATSAGICLHIDVIRGQNDHHKAEAAFKAMALALRDALTITNGMDIPSTKGAL